MPSISYPHCVDCGKQLDRPNRKRCWTCYCAHKDTQAKIIPTTRRCSTCRQEFSLTAEHFHHNKRDKAGFARRCKTCTSICGKQWRNENPERKRENDNRWRLNNLDRVNEKGRRWRKNNPKRSAEQSRQKKKRRREKNLAEARAKDTRYRQLRRARQLGLGGSYTVEEIQAQYERQNGRCYYAACGHMKLNGVYHIEHVIPLSRGGTNDISNIVLTCPRCNLSKHAKLPHEWPEGGRLL